MRSGLIAALVAIIALVLHLTAAKAADITAGPASDDPSVGIIKVIGQINEGDSDQFSSVIQGYSKAIVIFDSPGGNLFAGLQIGQVIRTHEFATGVADGAFCASACALAWLGGTQRYIQGSGEVGFHAAYMEDASGQKSESGVGNALVGAYLTRLGLSDDAIIYIEQADPDNITWLTPDDANRLGIDMTVVPIRTASAPSQTVSPPAATPTASAFVPPQFLPLIKAPSANTTQLATIVPPRSLSEPLVKPAMSPQQEATQFAEDYFAHWSEGNAQAISYFSSIYHDSVIYYGNATPKSTILKEKTAFVTRWPLRIYTVEPKTMAVTCDPSGSSCTVSGVVQWDCRSIARNAHSVGAANFRLALDISPTGVRVAEESGSVISRGSLN
ncbi:COG3904 family protein [Acidisoma silvae]|uniref:Uncharacterized protein n=1 Tax=Acidisoma silvae TaxID=2802396 RepID=A0A963YXV0_9PROT|nr:hypothetical protein [Acidisoma silvae]MCB8878255.1 hypothetical protein [Acidisoma silvae]